MATGFWSTLACVLGLLPCQEFAQGTIGSIPQYVMDYAPIVYLHSTERYFPAPIGSQLQYTTPQVNFTDAKILPDILNLNTLDTLNQDGGVNVSLSSIQDFTKLPSWLGGTKPDRNGRVSGSPSSAFITRDLGNGTLFAFYMFFYAYNYGLLNTDQHVGDWEYFALRFDDEQPTQGWYSQHSGGSAYTYDALEKDAKRPIVYSGNGTHANYATQGNHTVLAVATDQTDNGTFWDPALSAYLIQFRADTYHIAHGTYLSYAPGDTSQASNTSIAPTDWLYYLGMWGNAQLPASDPQQRGSGPLTLYTAGPTGPQDKDLSRNSICTSSTCVVMTNISQVAGD